MLSACRVPLQTQYKYIADRLMRGLYWKELDIFYNQKNNGYMQYTYLY